MKVKANKILRYFLIYSVFPIIYFFFSGYSWVINDLVIANVKYMYNSAEYTEQQKKWLKYGKDKYALCFYINQLPENAKIIYPENSILNKRYIRICKERSWVSSQIYPRIFISDTVHEKLNKVYKITYTTIENRDTFSIIPVP